MIQRHDKIKTNVFDYIHNRLLVGVNPSIIASEVIDKFPISVAFPEANYDTLVESMRWLIDFAYFEIKEKYYKE